MQFEWDELKRESNLKKHGVDFFEAITVFGDSLELTITDPDHSEGEARFVSMGRSDDGKTLVVSFVERQGIICVIGARRATRREVKHYEDV